MKISTRARYALRMMLDIGRHGDRKTPVSLTLVAERTGISRGYLEQLALSLRHARLVRAVVDCVDEPETCPRSEYCECRVVYALINQRIADVLDDFTLADLLDPSWMQTGVCESALGLVGRDAAGCEMDNLEPGRVSGN